jgi:hypothetical protein
VAAGDVNHKYRQDIKQILGGFGGGMLVVRYFRSNDGNLFPCPKDDRIKESQTLGAPLRSPHSFTTSED